MMDGSCFKQTLFDSNIQLLIAVPNIVAKVVQVCNVYGSPTPLIS